MNETIEEQPLPAIYGHCERAYQAMRAQAEPREAEGKRIIVWEGFLTRLLGEELKLPTPYYTSVKKNLERMGCARQLQRGGGNSPSQWELVRPPTAELFREKAPKRNQRDLVMETMRGQIADLQKRLGDLEKMLPQVVDFVNSKFNNTPEQPAERELPPHTHNPETGEKLITGTNSGHEVMEVTV